jgi:aminoglycoside N3'-acetyltransferase
MPQRVRPVTDLVADLGRLGVRAGDLLMVHASLRAVGPVEGRAAGVVEAIDAAVGPDGTWVMNLGAEQDGQPFDCRRTPADPEVGVLAEVIRTTPGTVVSDHPDARFAARGRLTHDLLDAVAWDDYYGPGSSLDRIVGRGGRVLRLGADPDTVTLIHLAEYLVELPDRRRVRRHHLVAGPDGPVLRTVDCLDDSDGIVEWPGEDYFATILRSYLAEGRARTGLVGGATSELIEGADLVAFAVSWMTRHFGRPSGSCCPGGGASR